MLAQAQTPTWEKTEGGGCPGRGVRLAFPGHQAIELGQGRVVERAEAVLGIEIYECGECGRVPSVGRPVTRVEAPHRRLGAEDLKELERAHRASDLPSSTLVAGGKTLFALQCDICHGAKGEGTGFAAPLTAPSSTRAQSVAGVMEELINPVGGGMPNFSHALSPEDKEELGAYVCVDITMKCEEAH